MKIALTVSRWLYGFASAFIGGGATVASSQAGLAVAKSFGFDAVIMDLKTMIIVFISSGIVACVGYLKQSPIPKWFDDPKDSE